MKLTGPEGGGGTFVFEGVEEHPEIITTRNRQRNKLHRENRGRTAARWAEQRMGQTLLFMSFSARTPESCRKKKARRRNEQPVMFAQKGGMNKCGHRSCDSIGMAILAQPRGTEGWRAGHASMHSRTLRLMGGVMLCRV